jgi:2-polyprenyl-6-methoxyphenol hydroxylase-like FAD-dependent oxidoreductase
MVRKAEIAGGGIGGLFCAWALASRGWQVRVHERSSEIRDVGAGIYLMRNSVSIFEHHGIAGRILKDNVILDGWERLDKDGNVIQARNFDANSPWYVVPRYALIQRLADIAAEAGVTIATGSSISAVDPAGALIGDDGTRYEADLVVIADGFRSKLRSQLGFSERVEERSSGAIRILVPRLPDDKPLFQEYWSGKRRIGIAPCSDKLIYAYLSSPNDDARASAIPLDVKVWQDAFPALRSFFDRVSDPSAAVRHAYPVARTKHWRTGRIAIIGDAAHALPPTLAQGAGLAMTNGYALAKSLDEWPNVEQALAEWEKKYRWISDQTQNWSVRLDSITTRWPSSLAWLRRAVIWLIGATLNSRVRVADNVRLVPAGVGEERQIHVKM